MVPQARQKSYAGQERVPEAGPSGSEAEITLAKMLSRCQMRIYCTRENIAYSMETSPQVRAHVINRLLSVQYGTVGMRIGKKSSEFGVPRGSTVWRARGPYLASGNSFPAPLCSALIRGHFFEPLPFRIPCWPLQGCRVPFLHRVTRYCVSYYLMSSQEPVTLGD
jgi:hypothetical protein